MRHRAKNHNLLKKVLPHYQLSLFGNKKSSKKSLLLRKYKRISRVARSISFSSKLTFVVCIFTSFIYILIFSDVFRVQNIEVHRKDSISNISSAQKSSSYLAGKHFFQIDENDVAARLTNSQPSLKYITIHKDFFSRSINIQLESYTASFALKNGAILENGSFINNFNTSKKDLFPLTLPSKPDLDKKLDFVHLQKIQTVIAHIKKNIPGFIISQAQYYPIEEEFILQGDKDISIIFDLEYNLKKQVEKLSIFHIEEQDITEGSYIYLDLRIPGKIYSCKYEEGKKCQTNLKTLYPY